MDNTTNLGLADPEREENSEQNINSTLQTMLIEGEEYNEKLLMYTARIEMLENEVCSLKDEIEGKTLDNTSVPKECYNLGNDLFRTFECPSEVEQQNAELIHSCFENEILKENLRKMQISVKVNHNQIYSSLELSDKLLNNLLTKLEAKEMECLTALERSAELEKFSTNLKNMLARVVSENEDLVAENKSLNENLSSIIEKLTETFSERRADEWKMEKENLIQTNQDLKIKLNQLKEERIQTMAFKPHSIYLEESTIEMFSLTESPEKSIYLKNIGMNNEICESIDPLNLISNSSYSVLLHRVMGRCKELKSELSNLSKSVNEFSSETKADMMKSHSLIQELLSFLKVQTLEIELLKDKLDENGKLYKSLVADYEETVTEKLELKKSLKSLIEFSNHNEEQLLLTFENDKLDDKEKIQKLLDTLCQQEDEIACLNNKLLEALSLQHGLHASNELLTTRTADFESELKISKEQESFLSEQLKKLNLKQDAYTEKVNKLSVDLQSKNEIIALLHKEISQLNQKLGQIPPHLDMLCPHLHKLYSMKNDITDLGKKITSDQLNFNTLRKNLEENLQSKILQISNLDMRLKSANANCYQLHSEKLIAAQSLEKQLDVLKKKCFQLENKLTNQRDLYSNQKSKYEQELGGKTYQIRELIAQCENLSSYKSQYKLNLGELSKLLNCPVDNIATSIKSQLNELTEMKKKWNDALQNNKLLDKECDELADRIKSLERDLNARFFETDKLENDLKSKDEKVKVLEKQLKSFQDALSAKSKGDGEKLQQEENQSKTELFICKAEISQLKMKVIQLEKIKSGNPLLDYYKAENESLEAEIKLLKFQKEIAMESNRAQNNAFGTLRVEVNPVPPVENERKHSLQQSPRKYK